MNATAKLAAFAVVVAAAFGFGFGAGELAGPFEDTDEAPTHGVHEMEAE